MQEPMTLFQGPHLHGVVGWTARAMRDTAELNGREMVSRKSHARIRQPPLPFAILRRRRRRRVEKGDRSVIGIKIVGGAVGCKVKTLFVSRSF